MAHQPILGAPEKSNVYDPEAFVVHALFGATSITTVFGKDIALVRNSPGNYTLTLPRTYRKLLKFRGAMMIASGATLFPVLLTDSVDTANTATAPKGGSIIFETRTAAGVATDPTAADKLFLEVAVSLNKLNDYS